MNKLAIFVSKIDRQHINFILAIAALAMLVLGIGAPSSGGGASPH
jgi:ABC-type antimicrobial peptide transport system permease subunit